MLFTDIEGSTRLLKQLGERYGELLAEHRRLLREAFAGHGGREMDTQGDAFFVAFARARHAVEAAVEAQRALAAHEWPDGVECRVRMGLHTGEPTVGDEGYHGIGLHRGARIAAAAHGGQILLSSVTADLVQDDLPGDMSLRDLGEQQLKDIDRPEHIYQVVAEGLASAFPPPRTGPPPKRTPARNPRPAAIGVAVVIVAVAAAVAVILGTRGGSGPSSASAAGVSADSVGIFHPTTGRLTGQIGRRRLAECGHGRRRLDLGGEPRRPQRLQDRPGEAGRDPDDPGRQRTRGDRLRRRPRLGDERPGRDAFRDQPADEYHR